MAESNNNFISKSDMMFFQNEVLVDLKKIESSVNTKLLKMSENTSAIINGYNEKFNEFSNKLKDLLEQLTIAKIDHEKVEELYRNKDRVKDQINENRTRIFINKKAIDSALYKYDKAIIDNLEVPGLIGANCKFSNISKFLDFTNGELNSYKTFKLQQTSDMKMMKDKIEKFTTKLELSNKDIIQRCDIIYTNKIDSFRKEIDLKLENKGFSISGGGPGNTDIDFNQLDKEIKNNKELISKIKEDMQKEIDNIILEIKKNKEMINADYIIVNKQKKDYENIKQQINELNEDFKQLKLVKKIDNENKSNNKNEINKNIKNKNKNKEAQKLSSSPNIIKLKDKNLFKKKSRNFNNEIKVMVSSEKINPSLTSKEPINKKYKDIDIEIRNKKRQKTLFCPNENKKENFLINESENIKNKNNKRFSHCQLNYYNIGNNINISDKNLEKNLLEISYNSFSSSNDKEDNKQSEKCIKTKTNNKNNELINEQVNTTVSQNNDTNKKINNKVTKLIKLKPIEKPIKLNLKDTKELSNILNTEISNINNNENIINDNKIKNKEKGINFTINAFKKNQILSKKSLNEINNTNINETSIVYKNINLTDKSILNNYINNLKKYKNKENEISTALNIKNYKDIFTSPLKHEIKSKNFNPKSEHGKDGALSLTNSNQKNSIDENNFSNQEIYNYKTPFNRNKNNKTSNLFFNIKNNYDSRNNKFNNLNGFLTSLPIRAQSYNEQEKDINNKQTNKFSDKLSKVNNDMKTIINRINSIERNNKTLNAQINNILMIIYLIYDFIKKKINNNKINKELFTNTFKLHFKDIKLKGQKSLISINKAKHYLYTNSGINLDEGGLYSSDQTKEELEIILKKIEPFLIKQFKDTI